MRRLAAAASATSVTSSSRRSSPTYAPTCGSCAKKLLAPAVPATPFRDLDELAARANNTPYGLAAGVWTRDISKAHILAGKLNAGTVWVNTYGGGDPGVPFGGYKQSGWGRERGHEVLELYTQTKSVVVKL